MKNSITVEQLLTVLYDKTLLAIGRYSSDNPISKKRLLTTAYYRDVLKNSVVEQIYNSHYRIPFKPDIDVLRILI